MAVGQGSRENKPRCLFDLLPPDLLLPGFVSRVGRGEKGYSLRAIVPIQAMMMMAKGFQLSRSWGLYAYVLETEDVECYL